MYPKNLDSVSPKVAKRIRIERRIVRSLLSELAKKGCTFTVDDGEKIHTCKTTKEAIDALMNTDEDQLRAFRGGEKVGYVLLVYGNDGWDVMADWSESLNELIPETLQLIAKLSDAI